MYDSWVIILLMGVEGSGKTTVGIALAERLGWSFADADDFHSDANKAKMSAGIPLTDEDRAPWLAAIRAAMDRSNAEHENLVITCSALKEKYRQQLAAPGTRLVYLRGTPELIAERIAARPHHFAKGNLLESQFQQLEEPTNALVIEIDQTVDAMVTEIVKRLEL